MNRIVPMESNNAGDNAESHPRRNEKPGLRREMHAGASRRPHNKPERRPGSANSTITIAATCERGRRRDAGVTVRVEVRGRGVSGGGTCKLCEK
ncbi:hypothetical protein MTP99_007450 [Tenebrio molitor]|nr:hypothetical protein MTP99_007450 [Tenebrio molitor]